VILNWRTADYAVRAARALIVDGATPARVVVVDNGSADGSAAQLRTALPECEIVELEENLGFARANNAGAATCPGAAYMFVNSDAFVQGPGSVDLLLSALDDPTVGLAVPRLLNQDLTLQPSVVPISTPLPELVRASGLSRFMPDSLQPRLGTYWSHGVSRDVQAADGAVILIRGRTWDELGGFDESLYMYAEDHELFGRAADRGWRTRFVADAVFVHLGGASARRRWDPPARAERIARGEARVIRARLGPFRSRLTLFLMAAGVGLRSVFHRLRGDREASAAQAAWFRGYASRSSDLSE
jgi:GT2 family glycosyltransferase